MTTRRNHDPRLIGLLLAIGLGLSAALTGCGVSEGAAPASTTTRPEPTSTTAPSGDAGEAGDDADLDISPEEADELDRLEENARSFLDEMTAEFRAGADLVLDGDQADCLVAALEKAFDGEMEEDDEAAMYEECGSNEAEVSGVWLAGTVLAEGASDDEATCVYDAVSSRTIDELDALSEAEAKAMFTECGVEPPEMFN